MRVSVLFLGVVTLQKLAWHVSSCICDSEHDYTSSSANLVRSDDMLTLYMLGVCTRLKNEPNVVKILSCKI